MAKANQVLEGLKIESLGGGWYRLPNGEKIQGSDNAIARMKEVINLTLGARALPTKLEPPSSETLKAVEEKQPTALALPKKRTKVAILGFTDTRLEAPFGNPEWEIWGLNELYRYHDARQFSRWFEIHDRKLIEEDKGVPGHWPPHIEALKQFPIPVYMHRKWDDIPNSVAYPKEEMEQAFPDGQYQTSSISWMIALAILEGFKEIGVYGVDMAQDIEYIQQRPACEYWIGMARGMGIKVYLPRTSDLLKAVGQYGWGDGHVFRAKLQERLNWLKAQEEQHKKELAALDNKRSQIVAILHQFAGAMQDTNYWLRSWSIPSGDSDKPFKEREVPLIESGPVDAEVPSGDGGLLEPSAAGPPKEKE